MGVCHCCEKGLNKIMGERPSSKMMKDILKSFKSVGINDVRIWDTLKGTQEISFYKDADNQLLFEIDSEGRMSGFSTINGVDNPVNSFVFAEQEIARFAHDVGTGPGHWRNLEGFRYLSLTDMANILGIRTTVMANYHLPFPDVYIGNTRGWSTKTFEKWCSRHSKVGKGIRGVKPIRPSSSQLRGKKGKKRRYEW